MPRLATVGASALFVVWGALASAQTFESGPMFVRFEADARSGRVHGVVRDHDGQPVPGASVIAVGGALLPVATRSGPLGQFALMLQPGEYILRVVRAGYLSTYRETIRILRSTEIERTIVLTPAHSQAAVPVAEEGESDHSHSATAWRLRHLTPTALRQAGSSPEPFGPSAPAGRAQTSIAAFFLDNDFSGQLNFLTTSSMALGEDGWAAPSLPRGVAYIALGAPVGNAGDWSVRGAVSGSALASWVMLGEYESRDELTHAVRFGVSYSSQPMVPDNDLVPATASDAVRRAGGIYGFDRWQVHPALQVEYGLRFDRYDYVPDAQFLSPRAGVRLRALPRTHVTLTMSQSTVAPGAHEFLPPSADGVWLPPERTFSPLPGSEGFRAERVRDIELGVERRLAHDDNAPVVALRRFRQSAVDQIATLFGVDEERDVGHYYVATPGSASLDGWAVEVSGPIGPRMSGAVRYTTSAATWIAGADAVAAAAIDPATVRPERDRIRDLATSFDAVIPETSTSVGVAYRISAARSADPVPTHGAAVGRYDVEVRQGLPLRPTRGSRTELVFLFRNLSRDIDDPGSLYDELLTVAPPLRVQGGVQIKF